LPGNRSDASQLAEGYIPENLFFLLCFGIFRFDDFRFHDFRRDVSGFNAFRLDAFNFDPFRFATGRSLNSCRHRKHFRVHTCTVHWAANSVTLVTPGTSAARFSSCGASLPSQRFPFDTLRFEPFRFATGRTFISHACTEPSSASHPHHTYRCDSIDISDLLIICCTACGLKHLGTFVALRRFSLRSWLHSLQTRALWCFRCASMFSVALPAALSAQSGRLLEPSSLRGEQRAHYLLVICQSESRFIATAIEGVPLRISFARPLRFVDSF
jgi:hypothetical protein